MGVHLWSSLAVRAAVRGYKIEASALPKNQVVNPDRAWANSKAYFKSGAGPIVGYVMLRGVVRLCA